MKRAALLCIASTMNNKEITELREKFYAFDKDHDGLSTNKDWGVPNSSGIRGLAIGVNGIKKDNSIDKSAIFCITVHHSTGSHNPWEDSIDDFKGQITYWGDAKYKKNRKENRRPKGGEEKFPVFLRNEALHEETF